MTTEKPTTWLQRAARHHPDRLALVTSATGVTYAELFRKLGRLCAKMDGVPRPFAVLTRISERIAWAVYLSLYSGRPLLPLDPDRVGSARLIGDCGIGRIYCDQDLDPELTDGAVKLPSDLLVGLSGKAVFPTRSPDRQSIQLYVATSGTGGRPRVAMLTAANLAAAVEDARARIPLHPHDRWLACLPLFHIGGLSILLRCLHAGACTVLHEGFDAERVWKALKRDAITHISLVPAMLWGLLGESDNMPPPSKLRAALVGGGPLSPALARRALDAGWPLCTTYGLTETASQVATQCDLSHPWEAGDVGLPLPGTRLEIVDTQGRPVRDVGRIRIQGPTVMAGYANPYGRRGDGLCDGAFVTNDLGFMDPDGHLHLMGRADDVLISGGETIHPVEVESRLSECPGVVEAAVTFRRDPVWGDVLVALVVGPTSTDQVRGWTRRHLGSRLRPREIHMVKALPRNTLGKLDRRALSSLISS